MSANQQPGAVHAHPAQAHPADAHDGQTRRSRRIARAVRRRAAARQPAGIILLVVLVLLALFTMLLISFVVATVANRQSVMQSARIEQAGDSPQTQLHDAFMQIVRGPRDSNSVIGPHSLLEDIYGHNAGQAGLQSAQAYQQGVRGTIMYTSPGPSLLMNGGTKTPILQFQVGLYGPGPPGLGSTDGLADFNITPPSPVSPFDVPPYGYYNGRLVTMITGPAAGRTAQIIGYAYNSTNNTHNFQTLTFDGLLPNSGDRFLINGRPFSGTGFGFRPLSFMSSVTDPGGPHPWVSGSTPSAPATRLLDACDPSGPTPTYNATSVANLGAQTGFQYALLPNPRRGVFTPFDQTGLVPTTVTKAGNYFDPAGPGGANEDYDAPDFQNMMLAMRIWGVPPLLSPPSPPPYQLWTPLPSLHRPDLISYWNTRWLSQGLTATSSNLIPDAATSGQVNGNPNSTKYLMARNLLRKATLRPLSFQDDPTTPLDESENPNFTGSNPYMSSAQPILSPYDPAGANAFAMKNLLYGPWDVDNDGDGTPDSVWVDLGLPVQTAPDGRRYKPLAAILCIDMDGKLNLNAHSNWRHPPSNSPGVSRFIKVNAPFARNDPTSTAANYYLRIGSGYGPPEISLNPVIEPGVDNTSGSILNPTQEMAKLFGGDTSSVSPIEGRYGEIGIAKALQAQTPPSSPGPGWTEIDDPMSWLRELDYPQITSFGNGIFPQLEHIYLPTTAAFGMAGGFSLDSSLFYSGNVSNAWTMRSNFGTPNDLDGDGMLALDLRGQPMYIDFPALINDNYAGGSGWGEHNDTIDDAYELDLSLQAQNDGYSGTIPTVFQNYSSNYLKFNGNTNNVTSVDAPFTPAELERILRWRDADAPALPDRLTMLAPLAFTSLNPLLASNSISNRYPNMPELAQMPNLLTTASFDVPMPSMTFTAPEQAFGLNNYRSVAANLTLPPIVNSHVVQLVAARVRQYAGTYNPHNVDLAISQLLAPELIGGEKLNINRILGNGNDDNSNGIVDEPAETAGEAAWGKATTSGTNIAFDLNNDGVAQNYVASATASPGASATSADDGKARQLLARYLYVLMMLLKDDEFQVFSDLDGDGYAAVPGGAITPLGQRDVAYYLAQWAINIVDFRDSDAIMTPFEFDINPFAEDEVPGNPNDGTWDVDGVINHYTGGGASPDDPKAYRGLVWGAERPELLITETLASHDRRTRDTNKDSTNFYVRSPSSTDLNFDQVRRPQGSLIIELYNPNQPLAIGNRIAGQAPNELYANTGTTDGSGAPMFGLDLGKTAGGVATGAPVWRLAVLSAAAADLLQPGAAAAGYPAFLPGRQPVLPYPNVTPMFPWPNQGIPNFSGTPAPQNATLMIGNTTIASPVNPARPFPAGMPIIDRVAYFTQQPTTGVGAIPSSTAGTLDVEAWRQFYAQSGATNVIVPPGRYAVVAPAAIVAPSASPDPYLPSGSPSGIFTALGARSFSGDSDTTGATYPTSIKDTYAQRIIIDPSISSPNVRIYGDANSTYFGAYQTTPPGMDIKPPIAIPMAPLAFTGTSVASLAPTYGGLGGTQYQTATQLARFSVSEPSAGYPTGQARIGSAPNWDENGYYATPVNQPYDDPGATYFSGSGDPLDTRRQKEITGIWQRGANVSGGPPMSCDSTQLQYTLVCLQRLADPTSPWDAHANPYITVDQMWVDLTTYSSEKYPIMSSPAIRDPEYPSAPVPPANPRFAFDTRQRGGPVGNPTPGWAYNNIWSSYAHAPASGGIGQGANLGGGLPLPNATLGYLNTNYGWAYATNPATSQSTSPYFHKQAGNTGHPQAPTSGANINSDDYLGDPTFPFPWLNWNNRPFVTAKEMMLVPTGSAHSMLNEMTVGQPGPVVTGSGGSPVYWPGSFMNNPNNTGAFEPPQATTQPANGMPMGEFGHLPNVFSSPQFDPTSASANLRGTASANLYRLFEYIHVPSRFTGTETWFPPAAMQSNATTAGSLPIHLYHPPFNRVSRLRDPGKVNINTVFDQFVWQGVLDEPNAALGATPLWRNMWNMICASRFGLQGQYSANDTFSIGGHVNSAYLQTNLNSLETAAPAVPSGYAWPSIFRAPFRSYSGHTLVPLDNMRRATSSTTVEREIDSTFLRASPVTTTPTFPLLEYPGFADPTNTGCWWDNSSSPQPAMNDPYRNPYFAYRDIRRLDNLLTTRSNVYAVWITLGYFEVSPAPSNDPQRAVKYPDGWVLGQEVGSDTGDIKRHRAFYMYDRSIPVGFERGENHNVQKGILLERFIE